MSLTLFMSFHYLVCVSVGVGVQLGGKRWDNFGSRETCCGIDKSVYLSVNKRILPKANVS